MSKDIQGLHLMLVHDPTKAFERIWRIRRPEGRIHKIVGHGTNADWLERFPPEDKIVIRNYDISEERLVSHEQAADLGRRHAENHAEHMRKAMAKGIDPKRLIYEGRNEPLPEEDQYLNSYNVAKIQRATELGVPSLALFVFSVGNPPTHYLNSQYAADWDSYEPTHKAMRPTDYVALHEYIGLDGPWALWPDGGFRAIDEPLRHLQCPWMDVQIILTEAGLDDGVNQNQKSGWRDLEGKYGINVDQAAALYEKWLAELDQEYRKDTRVKAVQLFTHDFENREWWKFDVSIDQLWEPYERWIQASEPMPVWGDDRTNRWQRVIEYRAAEQRLDPKVVATIVALESGGRMDVQSDQGAMGLMQVMPKETGYPDRLPALSLKHPDRNLKSGCAILRSNIDAFDGDLVKGIAAYYVGVAALKQDGIGPNSKFYLNRFRQVWSELWRDPCPVPPVGGGDTPPPPPPPEENPVEKCYDVDTLRKMLASLGVALKAAQSELENMAEAERECPPAQSDGPMTAAHPFLQRPLDWQYQVTQTFGVNADNYARFGLAGHDGVDYGAPEGTPIKAAHGGRIAIPPVDPEGYGQFVEVHNGDYGGFKTLYAHLSRYNVQDGQMVNAGDVIGFVGSTGNSTGPHLHFGLKFYRGANPAYRNWVDAQVFRA